MYGCFIVLIFYPNPALQILVYTISAQVVRLTTLPIDYSIKLPTKWYIATLVRSLFLRVSPNGLIYNVNVTFITALPLSSDYFKYEPHD